MNQAKPTEKLKRLFRISTSHLIKTAPILVILGSMLLGRTFGQDTNVARLPEVKVVGEKERQTLNEEQLVGDNQQPEWTTERRFATTRIYVLEPWQAQIEQWWKGQYLRDDTQEHLLQTEVEIGLPYRFQLDFYENVEKPDGRGWRHQGNQVELRYALADWGKIPLNPTLYGEWKFNEHEPDAYEIKILLGDEIAPRWHWGVNFAYEQEVSGGRISELAFSQAIGYTLLDQSLSLGAEMNVERASSPNFQGNPAVEVLIGPSLQWRPIPRIHLDIVPLIGVTHDSPRVEAYAILGIDFGKKSGGEHFAPTSLRSH